MVTKYFGLLFVAVPGTPWGSFSTATHKHPAAGLAQFKPPSCFWFNTVKRSVIHSVAELPLFRDSSRKQNMHQSLLFGPRQDKTDYDPPYYGNINFLAILTEFELRHGGVGNGGSCHPQGRAERDIPLVFAKAAQRDAYLVMKFCSIAWTKSAFGI